MSRFLSLLFLCVLSLPVIHPFAGSAPIWLREGVYAAYELTEDSNKAVFRWECIEVEGNIVELNLTYTASDGARRSAVVYVNAETRNVTSPYGKYLGKTLLWLPANPRHGENIALTDNLAATVRILGCMKTPQGYQNTFSVENWTADFRADYDLDTGVLIDHEWSREVTLQILNISIPTYWFSTKFVETNIDLGPRELRPEIMQMLPFLLPVIAFASIFTFLFYRQMKKRRRKTQTFPNAKCIMTYPLATNSNIRPLRKRPKKYRWRFYFHALNIYFYTCMQPTVLA